MVNERSIANFANFALAGVVTILFESFVTCDPLYVAITFILSYPWRIGKNLYSLFGGMNSEGGSVWSLFSIYQIADDNAISLFSLSLCQKADNDAVIGLGFSLLQKAGENAAIFAGFSFVQEAQNFQNGIFCIPFFQKKIEES